MNFETDKYFWKRNESSSKRSVDDIKKKSGLL